MKTLCVCQNPGCGEKTLYVIEPKICPQYCGNCKTKEGRKRMEEENLAIRKELEKNAT